MTEVKSSKKLKKNEKNSLKESKLENFSNFTSKNSILSKDEEYSFEFGKEKMAVVGISQIGQDIVNDFLENEIKEILTITYDAHQNLKISKSNLNFILGSDLNKDNLDENLELLKLEVLKNKEKIKKALQGIKIIFLVTNLNDATNMLDMQFAKIAQQMKIMTIYFVSNISMLKLSSQNVENFEKNSDLTILINQNLLNLDNKNTDLNLISVLKTFANLIQDSSKFLGIIEFLKQFKDKKGCSIAFAQAIGENKAIKAAKEVVKFLDLKNEIDLAIVLINCAQFNLSEINQVKKCIKSLILSSNIIFEINEDKIFNDKMEIYIISNSKNIYKNDEKIDNIELKETQIRQFNSFEDLLDRYEEDDLIGKTHSSAVNEESADYEEESQEFSWFYKMISYFFSKSDK